MFVALVMQHAVRMRHLSSEACQAQQDSYSLCLTGEARGGAVG